MYSLEKAVLQALRAGSEARLLWTSYSGSPTDSDSSWDLLVKCLQQCLAHSRCANVVIIFIAKRM